MSKWISVEKRLPEPSKKNNFGTSEYVLVANSFGDMVTAWYQHACDYQKARENKIGYEIGWHASFPQCEDVPLNNITNWTNRPEPPK